jgi:predicted P-loop ATPase
MTKLLETIALFHSNGFAVTPLRDKVPTKKGWQNNFNTSGDNFDGVTSAGWVIPKDYVVMDVDNHSADGTKLGSDNLKRLSAHYGFDFFKNAGVIVNTASGGYHLYYKTDTDKSILNSLADFPSVEFKHIGRQVVIPHSVLSDGRKYRYHILSRSFEDVIPLPENILNDLTRGTAAPKIETVTKEETSTAVLDMPADVVACEEFLKEQPELLAGDRNNTFYQLACESKDRGLSRKAVFKLLVTHNQEKVRPMLEVSEIKHCVNSAFTYSKNKTAVRSVSVDFAAEGDAPEENKILSEEETQTQLEEVIDWNDKLTRGKSGAISRTNFGTRNTEIFLENLPQFKKRLAVNLFSMDTIWRQRADWHKPTILSGEIDKVLDDDDLIRMREVLNQVDFDPTTGHILEASRAVSLRNEYHPVKEYFEALPKWDGVERLAKFFPDFCGAEDCAYTQQIGIKIFTAIVARIYTPGCKFDYLPIIIGEQGIGKSTLLEAIAIKPQWYTDNLGSIDNKDVILRMRSKLIVENAELTMFDKSDPNTVKAFLSRRVDRDRLPYDRLPRDLPRQCIIIATTNKDRFLQDETGNRRMWPIEVTKISLSAIKRAIPMFYAEAIHRFKAGEQLYLDDTAAHNIAVQKQEERYNSDDWELTISSWIEENDHQRLTIGKIWGECFTSNITHCGFREQKRIGSVLRRLGWVRATIKMDGKICSGFKK